MIRNTLHALGLLGLTAGLTFASHIVGGMTQYGVFSSDGQVFNNHYSTGGTTTLNDGLDAGNRFGFNGADPITFTGGGTFQTVPFAGADYNDFHSLTSTLSALGGTPIVSWVGLTPGNYTFTTAPTSLTLTAPGIYVFSYAGSTSLAFNNVDIILDPALSSDDVVWYVPQTVSMSNSIFGGVLVVDGFGATVEASGGSTVITGRVLAESAVSLDSWNNGDLTFNTQITNIPTPEPSTIFMLFPALAIGAVVRRRLIRQ